MKRSDEIVLDGLEPFALQMVSAEQWALTKQAVADAGGILASDGVVRDLLEKASFASRSEAGRYAANQRWKGHAKGDDDGGGRGAENPARGKYTFSDYEYQQVRTAIPQISADDAKKLTQYLTDNNAFGDMSEMSYQEMSDEYTQYLDDALGGEANSDPANPADEQSAKMATRAKSIDGGDLSDIALIIRRDLREQGKKVPAAAEPYLDAMASLGTIDDNYYMDSGSSIVAYLLGNLGSYKGETARLVKAELKARLKGKKGSYSGETNDSPESKNRDETKRFLEEAEGDLEVEIDLNGANSKMARTMRTNIARIKSQMGETNDSPEFTGRTTGRQGGPAVGPKYKKGMSLKEITASVRQDVKAIKLPPGVKLGVRMRDGLAVVIDIKGYTGDQNSPEAKALKAEIEAVRDAYNRSNSDPMSDYSDETYYGNTDFN